MQESTSCIFALQLAPKEIFGKETAQQAVLVPMQEGIELLPHKYSL